MKKDYLNYYLFLEVDPTATTEEIKAAYKMAALKFHPDKQCGSGSATKLFQMLNEVKKCLLDPEERRKYDESIGIATPLKQVLNETKNHFEFKNLLVIAFLCLLAGFAFGASTK